MRILRILTLLAAVLLLGACDIADIAAGGQRFQRDFHFSYPLNNGGAVSVEGFNGAVEVSSWDQNEVDISGVKYGATQEAADALRIDVEHTPDSVSIRAVRPSDRRSREGARFAIKIPKGAVLTRIITSNGAIRTQDGAGPARFRTSNGEIRVQTLAGALDAQTSNGRIELIDVGGDASVGSSNGQIRASGLKGSLDASTSNGGITAQVNGKERPVRAQTSNGSIDVTLPDGYANDLRMSTSNGSITVRIPGQPNARVSARTSNSSINSDFEVKTSGSSARNRLEGTIGAGGGLFDLSTSNGGIRLVKM